MYDICGFRCWNPKCFEETFGFDIRIQNSRKVSYSVQKVSKKFLEVSKQSSKRFQNVSQKSAKNLQTSLEHNSNGFGLTRFFLIGSLSAMDIKRYSPRPHNFHLALSCFWVRVLFMKFVRLLRDFFGKRKIIVFKLFRISGLPKFNKLNLYGLRGSNLFCAKESVAWTKKFPEISGSSSLSSSSLFIFSWRSPGALGFLGLRPRVPRRGLWVPWSASSGSSARLA